jgi:cellulose synthase/poly-beta-1,6-N-acetylglucosamine synthase-like glycosyltransferase
MIPGDNIIMFVIFLTFCVAVVIQLFYWLWFYLTPYFYKAAEIENGKEPVSVIICARNEADNLRNFLTSVLEQDYPSYEVIVVNDCSEDSSDDVLGKLLLQYPHLKISSITKDPKFTHNKKFAQFIGIKAATNEILIFTDADCQPESDKWLSYMTSNFDNKTDFVLGYGGYLNEKGLLNKYVRFDSMFIAMQYFGMALKGIPYMGVGRNLAYRRSMFFRNKGFGVHNHIISGDDDLFVNSNASKADTRVEFRPGSHTRSVPSSTTAEFIKQKLRHFTTAKYYKTGHKLLLSLEPFTRMLFYVIFAVLVSELYLWPYITAIFGLRLIVQIVVLALIQKKLNEHNLLIFSLIFDIFSPVINGVMYFSGFRKRPVRNTWK